MSRPVFTLPASDSTFDRVAVSYGENMHISLIFKPGAAIALGVLVAAMLTACGGGDSAFTAAPAAPPAPAPAAPTASLGGPARVVANTLYSHGASLSPGAATAFWNWGDGSANGDTNPASHVWNRPGSFNTAFGATVNGSAVAATQTTVVVGKPVSSGAYHNCVLKPGGTVACWGLGNVGQLGDGTTVNKPAPIAVPGLGGVIALGTAFSHSCALKSDGTVACWGSNTQGELGQGGTSTFIASPVAVPALSGVAGFSAGGIHTCVLKTDASVACWGYNAFGQLGDGTTADKSSPVAVPGLSGVQALAAGALHSCALKSDGDVACWGRNNEGQLGDGTLVGKTAPVAVPGLGGVVALSAGYQHSCALKSDGTIVCWGGNAMGQLGDGTVVDKATPVAVAGLTGAIALSASTFHTCALKSDGTVACWGSNASGQLGDGTTTNQPIFVAVPGLNSVVAVSTGALHTCALKSDGSAACWGDNSSGGQIGDGTSVKRPAPTLVSGGAIFWK